MYEAAEERKTLILHMIRIYHCWDITLEFKIKMLLIPRTTHLYIAIKLHSIQEQ